MSRKKKTQIDSEPKIHLVDGDLEVRHEHVQITAFGPDDEDPEEVVEETKSAPAWEDVKHSIDTLKVAYFEVKGVRLRDSDLYAMMYTSEHKSVVTEYLKGL